MPVIFHISLPYTCNGAFTLRKNLQVSFLRNKISYLGIMVNGMDVGTVLLLVCTLHVYYTQLRIKSLTYPSEVCDLSIHRLSGLPSVCGKPLSQLNSQIQKKRKPQQCPKKSTWKQGLLYMKLTKKIRNNTYFFKFKMYC